MATLNWAQIPGGLVQVSAAGDIVWGVNANDQIYRWNGSGWENVSGAACHVSVGWDGSVWCCNKGGKVYRWHGNTSMDGGWQLMPGEVTTLGVRSYNDVWATNAQQKIWHWDGQNWTQIDGAAVQIAVGKDGHVACVNAGGNIYIRDGVQGQWAQIPGQATQVSVYKKGVLACVNAGGNIYLWENGAWKKANGEAHWVSVPRGSFKDVWVVNKKSSGIFRHGTTQAVKNTFKGYNWKQVPGGLVKVAGAGKEIWGVNAGENIYRFTGNGWEQIGGAAVEVSVGYDGSVWCANKAGKVYRWHGNRAVTNGWQLMEGQVTSLAVRSFNDVWACNAQQAIWHWNGIKWTQIDGQAVQIAVGKDGHVACVNAAGNIYVRDGLQGKWTQVPGQATQIAVRKKGEMACVNSAGKIYAFTNGAWQNVPGEGHWIAIPKGHKDVWVCNKTSSGIFRHSH